MTNNEEYEAGLIAILQKIRENAPSFPTILLDSVEDLIRHWEFRIALENLCDNVCEAGLALPKELNHEIVIFAQRLGVGEEYWRLLQPDPIS